MKTKLVPERIPGELLKLSEVEVKQCYQRNESVFGSVANSVCASQKQEDTLDLFSLDRNLLHDAQKVMHFKPLNSRL